MSFSRFIAISIGSYRIPQRVCKRKLTIDGLWTPCGVASLKRQIITIVVVEIIHIQRLQFWFFCNGLFQNVI